MKITLALLTLLITAPAYAELYKCKVNGKTIYQGTACKGEGGEFKLRRDISPEQQKAAQERLSAELAAKMEQSTEPEGAAPKAPPTIIIPGAAPQPAAEPSSPGIDMIYNSPGTLN